MPSEFKCEMEHGSEWWTAPLQLGSMQAKMKNVQAGIELTMVVTLFKEESIELSR